METMAAKGEHYVTVEGSTDKRSMTGTFSISFDGNFLPVQPIYGGKTTQSLPRFGFPKDFSLSTNSKHFSNTDESLKFLKVVIMDVFTRQMTTAVFEAFKEANVSSVSQLI